SVGVRSCQYSQQGSAPLAPRGRTMSKPLTLAELATARLSNLCYAVGISPSQTATAVGVFRTLSASWGGWPASLEARWPSDITDDHSPFEFSLALEGDSPEVRFLIEVQGETPSVQSNWIAARVMNERLAVDLGAHLGRFADVEDLFTPSRQCP